MKDILLALPLIEVEPVAFERGSTLCIVKVGGKDMCGFVGTLSRIDANAHARSLHQKMIREAFDAVDAQRRLLGRPQVSRPNVWP